MPTPSARPTSTSDALDPAEVGARIRRRPESVARSLVAALDHWTAVRTQRGAKGPAWHRLVAACRAADPDPDRDALRASLLIEDKKQRREQSPPAGRASRRLRVVAGQPGASCQRPGRRGDVDGGVAVLTTCFRDRTRATPGSITTSAICSNGCGRRSRTRRSVRTRSPEGCVPEMAHELAHALEDRGRSDEAEAVFRDLVRRRPTKRPTPGVFRETSKGEWQERRIDGHSGAGDRREPRGSSARARRQCRPQQSRPCPELPGKATTRRLPSSARRSGSTPITPRLIATSALP